MSAIGIFGLWKGGNEERVRGWMHSLYVSEPEDVIVSGGEAEPGVWAEQEWLALGGKVVSFRPVATEIVGGEQQYGVERWDLGIPNPSRITLEGHLTFKNLHSARIYRDMLIAETVDKAVGFYPPRHPENFWARDIFFAQNKPIYVFEEG